MIVSILTRKVRVQDRSYWEAQLRAALPSIVAVLEAQAGFLSAQYLWGIENNGETAQITTWKSWDDCRRYVRGGGAAMVATLEEAVLPTAPYPEGTWVRKTFAVLDSGGDR